LKEFAQPGLDPGVKVLKALSAVSDHRPAKGLPHGIGDFHRTRDKQFDV
jgi:hypothetical protein